MRRMTENSYPTVKLRPLKGGRHWRKGAPWIFTDQIAWDRRTKSIEPGSFARLRDIDGQEVGVITVNPHSKIAGRLLDTSPTISIDEAWIHSKLARALALREQLFDKPFYRWIHAEGDGLPGVIIDRFDDVVVVQPNAAWAERMLDHIAAAVQALTSVTTVLKNAEGRTRSLEQLDDVSAVLCGRAPSTPIPVHMNGAIYMADVMGGQKTGLFYDQRFNHRFAAQLSHGKERVLDVFSHVGGFSLAALAGGAQRAEAVDASQAALDLAQNGASEMGRADDFSVHKGDAFDVMTRLLEAGERYDVVICDPPAFAPHKAALENGLRAYEKTARMGAKLVKEGGYLGLCSCSHSAGLDMFRAASVRGIERAGRHGSLIHTGFAGPDHPQHAALSETGYLKALFFAL